MDPVLIITRLLSLPNATKIGLLTLESFSQCLFRPASTQKSGPCVGKKLWSLLSQRLSKPDIESSYSLVFIHFHRFYIRLFFRVEICLPQFAAGWRIAFKPKIWSLLVVPPKMRSLSIVYPRCSLCWVCCPRCPPGDKKH